jgi:hypothetical protein
MTDKNVLIYVEDPGAANFVIGVPEILKEMNYSCTLLADGTAVSYLKYYGESPMPRSNSHDADSLISYIHPHIVVIGTSENSNSFGFEIVIAAREKNITSVGIVDAYVNSEHRFRGNTEEPLKYAPDILVVPDNRTKKKYLDLGLNENDVFVVGNPIIDFAREIGDAFHKYNFYDKRVELFGDGSKYSPVIVFVSELSDGLVKSNYLYSEDYTMQGWGDSKERTEIVFQELVSILREIKSKPILVLRLHPKEDEHYYRKYSDDIKLMSQGGDPLQLAYFADVVVGLSTTLLLEAATMGVPVISIVPREMEREWVPMTDNVSINIITNKSYIESELLEAIRKIDNRVISQEKSVPSKNAIANVIASYTDKNASPSEESKPV